MEGDVKPPEVKEKLPIKRSKGSLGSLNMITGKNNELGKASGTSANGAYSKRLFNFSRNCPCRIIIGVCFIFSY